MNTATTEEINFPILVVGKFGLMKYRRTREELVEQARRLRKLSNEPWFHLVDNDLNRYRIMKTEIICGHGFPFGYSFDGAYFLKRTVRFRADLKFVTHLDLKSTADIMADFIGKADGALKDDVTRFWTAFGQYSSAAEASLSSLWSFYSSFKWGDDLDDDE